MSNIEIYTPAWLQKPFLGFIPLNSILTYFVLITAIVSILVLIGIAKKVENIKQLKTDAVIAVIFMNPVLFPVALYKILKVALNVLLPEKSENK